MKMMAQFLITHIHTKKDKAGDRPGPMRSHLKLETTVQVKDLVGLFGTNSGYERFDGFWNDEDELASSEFRAFPLETEIVGGVAFIKPEFSDGTQFDRAELKDVAVELQPGRTVLLTAKLQLPGLQPAMVGLVQSWEGLEMLVSVSPAQQELEFPAPAKEAGEQDPEDPPHAGLLDGGIDRALAAGAEVSGTVQQLREAGTITKVGPVTVGVVVEGQKPPQRPRGAANKAH